MKDLEELEEIYDILTLCFRVCPRKKGRRGETVGREGPGREVRFCNLRFGVNNFEKVVLRESPVLPPVAFSHLRRKISGANYF